MVAVAKKDAMTFPVTPEWKQRVRAELDLRGRGAHSMLARAVKCKTGQLSELLQPESKYSHLVAAINAYFGWPAPIAPSASKDAGELLYGYDRMDGEQRAMMIRAKDVIEGLSGDDAKAALEALLTAFRKPRNDKD